jgi:hypothetical protein
VLKGIKPAARSIPWICKQEGPTSIDILTMLISSRVMSRIRVGMALQNDGKEKSASTQQKYSKLRTVITDQIKLAMKLPDQLNGKVILAEMGIMDIPAEIELEMLRVYGRARRKKAGIQVLRAWAIRNEDMKGVKGDTIGFFPAIKRILTKIGLKEAWTGKLMDNKYKESQWKAITKTKVRASANATWREFAMNHGPLHNNYHKHKKQVVREAYLDRGTPTQIALKMCFKYGALRLKDTKHPPEGKEEKEKIRYNDKRCELCRQQDTKENEDHLLHECKELEQERNEMISFLDRTKRTITWRPKSNSQLKEQLLKTWEYNRKAKKNLWNEAKDDALKRFLERIHKKFEDITKRDIMKTTNFRKAATNKRYREHTAIMAEEINTMINKRKRKSAEEQE